MNDKKDNKKYLHEDIENSDANDLTEQLLNFKEELDAKTHILKKLLEQIQKDFDDNFSDNNSV